VEEKRIKKAEWVIKECLKLAKERGSEPIYLTSNLHKALYKVVSKVCINGFDTDFVVYNGDLFEITLLGFIYCGSAEKLEISLKGGNVSEKP